MTGRSKAERIEDVELDILALTYTWAERRRGQPMHTIGEGEAEQVISDLAQALTQRVRRGLANTGDTTA